MKDGPHLVENKDWNLIHGRQRGLGIAFHKSMGTHSHTMLTTVAMTTVLITPARTTLGIVSGPVSHKFTIDETAGALQAWGETPQKLQTPGVPRCQRNLHTNGGIARHHHLIHHRHGGNHLA